MNPKYLKPEEERFLVSRVEHSKMQVAIQAAVRELLEDPPRAWCIAGFAEIRRRAGLGEGT